ncbi:MAG: Ig-like domain-containing protein [Bacteroidales bacterium]|nr:Ig-like domain-containing protein [Bacteroidales bacterium]MBP9028235.1 Ig-like domain-containing protein [Bacteroidales bacterium]
MKRILITVGASVLVLLMFPRCAKVVSPTGGPKDTIPPVLVNSNPKLNATGFSGQKIVLEFDEFIQLKELQQKLLVSPPLKSKPQPKQKGKKLELELTDTLKPNTTYTFYFSDAVRDNNEGNPIKNFIFSFSTGQTIDTLTLSGRVLNAITNEPVENALVMLYDSFTDTLPYTTLPNHIAKTDKDGKYTLVNLKPIKYKLVVVDDKNGNYLYNQGSESIGFISYEVNPSDKNPKSISIRLFREELPNQIVTGYDRPERNILSLGFSRKPVGGFSLKPVDRLKLKNWYVVEPDNNGDTLKLWIVNDEIANRDTLMAILEYQKTDSLYRLKPQTDTLRFLYYKEEVQQSKRKGKKDETAQVKKGFTVGTSLPSDRMVIPNVPFELTLPIPIRKADNTKISIFNTTDSIAEEQIKLKVDSLNPRIFRFEKDWKPNTSYKLNVLPGAFEDYTGQTNDTLMLEMIGADPEKYGILRINLTGVSKSAVVELLSEKGIPVDARTIQGNGIVEFSFVKPGKYRLRFIDDSNSNGKWDSGSYLKRIQPERVIYFTDEKTKGVINIRANWDSELQFSLKQE